MDIFGLTSVDSALSVLGLNYAQLTVDFLFYKTPVAIVVFTGAFLLGLWQMARSGQYRHLITFFLAALTIVLLLLPKRQEGDIKSAVEHYSQSAQSSQSIKNQILNYHQIPVILGFIAQMGDALMIGIIRSMDAVTPQWANYLTAPFGLHRGCLNIREAVQNGIEDIALRQKAEDFLYDHYLPSVSMLRIDLPSIDINELWPGHARIVNYYSSDARRQWEAIERELRNNINQNPAISEKTKAGIGQMMHLPLQDIEGALLRSFIRFELQRMAHRYKPSIFWRMNSWVLTAFPYLCGWAQLILYAMFPFLLLAFAFSRRVDVLSHYLRIFCWVKSWDLGGAVCFYFSLFIARLQAQASTDPSWAWEHPYFCVAAGIILGFMPVGTFLIINKVR